ncbi:hypothetical protein FKM82_023933 [Ascaphus truei]
MSFYKQRTAALKRTRAQCLSPWSSILCNLGAERRMIITVILYTEEITVQLDELCNSRVPVICLVILNLCTIKKMSYVHQHIFIN